VEDELDRLIQRADLDELVRHVDNTCAARDWSHLVDIRNQSRAAVSTGRQLWPIATLANHRLALWAPADLAVRALDDTARTFMPGPVSEILAVHHTWEALRDHLPEGHDRSLVAHERALRGDVIDAGETSVLDVPFETQPWEPRYLVATYTDDGVEEPFPRLPRAVDALATTPTDPIDDDDTIAAFRHLVEPWTAQSNGRASIVVVEGSSDDALGALGLTHALVAPLTHLDALAWLAWAGASGGAHGKRRGSATGRAEAWWFLATFAGIAHDWPCDPDELGEIALELDYTLFTHDKAPTGGWGLNLVIEDHHEGLSVAINATDFE
jgi:hypothetical protein